MDQGSCAKVLTVSGRISQPMGVTLCSSLRSWHDLTQSSLPCRAAVGSTVTELTEGGQLPQWGFQTGWGSGVSRGIPELSLKGRGPGRAATSFPQSLPRVLKCQH